MSCWPFDWMLCSLCLGSVVMLAESPLCELVSGLALIKSCCLQYRPGVLHMGALGSNIASKPPLPLWEFAFFRRIITLPDLISIDRVAKMKINAAEALSDAKHLLLPRRVGRLWGFWVKSTSDLYVLSCGGDRGFSSLWILPQSGRVYFWSAVSQLLYCIKSWPERGKSKSVQGDRQCAQSGCIDYRVSSLHL